MSSAYWVSLLRRVCFLGGVSVIAVSAASAQFALSPVESGSNAVSASESSSNTFPLVAGNTTGGMEALPAAPSAAGSGGGQAAGSRVHGLASHLAFEAGGGFSGPTSDSSNYITWGGNFTVGAGYRLSPYLSLLTEYQFIDDKLPGKLIAETGANGGHAHIWSFTMAPVIDLMPKSRNDLYVTGGGGFYRKVTSFTDPEPAEYCDYYDCGIVYEATVVGHFSSNQGGWNVGGGFTHRIGGTYNDSRMKLFAEVRYLNVDTPAVNSSPNGLGTTTVAAGTKIIPVTFGVRW
jgi:hypothetical protein